MRSEEIFSYEDPREILVHIFEAKKIKNPLFSLRAWSKRLGFKNPSYLSDILNNKRKLKVEFALKISPFLELPENERNYFETLVYLTNASSDEEKEYFRSMLLRLKPEDFAEWQYEKVRLKDWFYWCLDEMLCLKDFREDYAYIARRLGRGLTAQQVELAFKELLRWGLIDRDSSGRLVRPKKNVVGKPPPGANNPQIEKEYKEIYQKRILEFARRAVDEQTEPDGFDMQTNMLPMKLKDVQKLKERMLEFRNETLTAFDSNKDADELYSMSIQMFRVSLPEEKEVLDNASTTASKSNTTKRYQHAEQPTV